MAFVRVPGNDVPAGAEEHWLEARGGVQVRLMTAPAQRGPARGSVIVCPGRTEFIEKYFEVVRELQARGFNVMCIDWRGQGLSGREQSNALKGHFNSFDDPVNDLAAAIKQVGDLLPRPHILLAHSMGGAITLRAMQFRRVEFDAAVFCAPMWAIASLGNFAKRYAKFMTSFGGGGSFAPGVEKRWKRESFKRNPVTHDKERHARCQALLAEEPRLAIAGPTLGWVHAAAEVTDGFVQPGVLAHLRLPVLVLSAEQELFVDNRRHQAIVEMLPHAQLTLVAGAKHEILMETDPVRAQFWTAFDDMTDKAAPRRS